MTLKHQCIMQNNDTGVSAKNILIIPQRPYYLVLLFQAFLIIIVDSVSSFMFSTVPSHIGTGKAEHDFTISTTGGVLVY